MLHLADLFQYPLTMLLHKFFGCHFLLILAASGVLAEPYPKTLPLRTLQNVQESMGITNHLWDGDSLTLSNETHQLRFYTGRKKVEVDGTVVWFNAPATGNANDGSWSIAAVDLDFLTLALLPEKSVKPKALRIMLDAGHGGDDEGASSIDPPMREKELALVLAKQIGGALKKAGMHVEYTRTQDTTLTLEERTRMAVRKKADLFISIHANHAANTNAAGVETYVLPPSGFGGTAEGTRARGWQIGNRNDFHNTMLGYAIHSKLVAVTNNFDRGLKRQSFFVLRENSCPAVLLEFGFLSNPSETARMCDTNWQKQCCAAVARGVLAYAGKVEELDAAVLAKRQRDAEANERWRKYLASKRVAEAAKTNEVAKAVDADAPTATANATAQ